MDITTSTFAPFTEIDLPLPGRREGKVRVTYELPTGTWAGHLLLVTTDRLSAFDRVLAGVAYKGQVLNQLSAWWFDLLRDVVANHAVATPDPNALVARPADPLPVEVVVRGAITGVTDTSLWRRYADGARVIDGHRLPDGLRKNTFLPTPIITPTTKAAAGQHDRPLSCADVVDEGLLDAARWDEVQQVALELFRRGSEIGRRNGLLLADTKYEFGLDDDGRLLLIDEVHTPDSSRWWVAQSHEARLAAGDEPESLDKEFVRRAFADLGYTGDGPTPTLPDEVWTETSARYVDAYRRLTGEAFVPGSYPVPPRLTAALTRAGAW